MKGFGVLFFYYVILDGYEDTVCGIGKDVGSARDAAKKAIDDLREFGHDVAINKGREDGIYGYCWLPG